VIDILGMNARAGRSEFRAPGALLLAHDAPLLCSYLL
jgi:hypothetical protein